MTETITLTEQEILDQITAEVAANKVFLYLKGTPEQPRCGFSNQVVQILNHLGVEYGSRDILVDPRIRQVLSGWSDWPTIPAALRRRQARRRVRHRDRDVPGGRAPAAARRRVVGVNPVFAADEPLAELHAHLGGGVNAATMWELAHEQGIKLPYRDYWHFAGATNVGGGTDGLDGLDQIYHLTELIQSSPEGVFRAVHGMISGGYRSQRITTHEVRFNPAKRNRGGERDLDAIVMAAVHGIDRASLEYPVRAGLILMMDRGFPPELNAAIVERAIRFRDRGVIAIDIGGPRPGGGAPPYPYRDLAPLVERARATGLGVTLHAGEEGVNAPDPGPFVDEMHQVLDLGRRSGRPRDHHRDGPRAPGEGARQTGVVLEICPTSNVRTGAVRDEEQMAEIVFALDAAANPRGDRDRRPRDDRHPAALGVRDARAPRRHVAHQRARGQRPRPRGHVHHRRGAVAH